MFYPRNNTNSTFSAQGWGEHRADARPCHPRSMKRPPSLVEGRGRRVRVLPVELDALQEEGSMTQCERGKKVARIALPRKRGRDEAVSSSRVHAVQGHRMSPQ